MKDIFVFKEKDVITGSLSPNKKFMAIVVNNGMATALLLFKKENIDFSKPYAELLIHDSTICPLKEQGARIIWNKNSDRVGVINSGKYLYGVIDLKNKKKIGATIIMGYILALDSDMFSNGIPENAGEDLNEKMKPKLSKDTDENVISKGFVSPDAKHAAFFADNGERGVIFYYELINEYTLGNLLYVFSIYNRINPSIKERKNIDIRWTKDGTKIGLIIDDSCYAIIDVVNVSKKITKTINPEMKPLEIDKQMFEHYENKESDELFGKCYYLFKRSPSDKMLALFYDDGFSGVIRVFKLGPMGNMIDELVVFPFYSKIEPTINNQRSVEIKWTDDSSRVSLFVSGEIWVIIDFKTQRKISFDVKNGIVIPINPVIWEKGIPKNIGIPLYQY